ncbi:MAG TPA: pyridoxamine 5'-phosphate oxidase family protein [Thermoanaerobaculia bacterium]|jgi:hypothetical protein|nr:pyridoxamine 5'-phosphate oxidase family protein [Thermoanaerobaculia bacterium]
MSERHPEKPLTQVRRRNREVEDESWIRDFLRRAPTCTLATVAGGQPFLNTNLFFFDEPAHLIYIHTAAAGRTRDNIAADGRVCLTVAEMGRLLPAEKVTDYSTEYASVVIFGRATVVTDPRELRHVLHNQLDKYFPHLRSGRDYQPFSDEESGRAAAYRITIDEWSAKQNRAAPDYPGAFWYPESLFRRDP